LKSTDDDLLDYGVFTLATTEAGQSYELVFNSALAGRLFFTSPSLRSVFFRATLCESKNLPSVGVQVCGKKKIMFERCQRSNGCVHLKHTLFLLIGTILSKKRL
jgi:hypothetical protein